MKITSVNLGKRETVIIGGKTKTTGIWKRPVTGKVRVTAEGLLEDAVVNTVHHGGVDQALYLYSAEDYSWWERELNRELLPGTFGENLTLSDFGTAPLRVGDRLRINNVLLEITAPRIPCGTLAARMNDTGFVKRFVAAERPGCYVRVLETGELQAGDAVEFIPATNDYPTILEIFSLWYAKERDAEALRRILQAPIAERARIALNN